MQDLTKLHAESMREILDLNRDLEQRLSTLSVSMLHDRDDDLFILTIGEAQEAITESVGNLLYFRLEPDTLKIVGIEIPHASRRLKDEPLLGQLLRWSLSALTDEPAPRARFAEALRELVGSR